MNKLVKFFGDIVTSIWCSWSNTRFKQAERFDTTLEKDEIIQDIFGVTRTAREIYNNFEWTKDGIDQLGDAIVPPPQNYRNLKNAKLKDDCDGFHSALYHYMYNSGYECYLLSVVAIDGGHCVLIYKDESNKWRVVDYKKVYESFCDMSAAIEDYNTHYQKVYKLKAPFYNGLVLYNYVTGKFSRVKIK